MDKTPPCSAAEFEALVAWLAAHGDALPSVGWQKAIGDGATATLSDLRWRVGHGATAAGSGGLAETLRKLKAKYSVVTEADVTEGEREPDKPRWPASVIRDDGDACNADQSINP